MGIQSFTPSSGGGIPGMSYIASIFMETFARSWSQGGTPGYYMISSANNSTGYVYFIGAQTTGGPLGKTLSISHAFTSIEIVANKDDLVSLYKAAAKTTTNISSPGSRYVDWLYNAKYTSYVYKSAVTNTSSPWVLPKSAMPLIDVNVIAGGGGAHHHGGGGGGGGVVSLSYYPVSTSVSWTIGAGGTYNSNGGNTVLDGTITAVGGAYGRAPRSYGLDGGNGAGAASHASTGGTQYGGNPTQTTPTVSSPTVAVGYGFRGGNINQSSQHVGAGGGGSGGAAADQPANFQGIGGSGHLSQIDYQFYGAGGGGANHDLKFNGVAGQGAGNFGQGANSNHDGQNSGTQGGIVLRYYA
jgi:hypothetical protein